MGDIQVGDVVYLKIGIVPYIVFRLYKTWWTGVEMAECVKDVLIDECAGVLRAPSFSIPLAALEKRTNGYKVEKTDKN